MFKRTRAFGVLGALWLGLVALIVLPSLPSKAHADDKKKEAPAAAPAAAPAPAAPAASAFPDPVGAATGSAGDVTAAKMGEPTLAEVATELGHTKVAVNFVWTLVAGFLVMFMQAGFMLVETASAVPRTPRTPLG